VTVQRNGRRRLEQLAVDGAQDPHNVVAPRRAAHNCRVLINRFQELADDEGDALDALDLFLGAEELAFEVARLVLDVVFLKGEELEVGFELGELEKKVFVGGRESREEGGRVLNGRGEGRVLMRREAEEGEANVSREGKDGCRRECELLTSRWISMPRSSMVVWERERGASGVTEGESRRNGRRAAVLAECWGVLGVLWS
jgi:hypothetical protein